MKKTSAWVGLTLLLGCATVQDKQDAADARAFEAAHPVQFTFNPQETAACRSVGVIRAESAWLIRGYNNYTMPTDQARLEFVARNFGINMVLISGGDFRVGQGYLCPTAPPARGEPTPTPAPAKP
jgi:hypothetical protein